MILKQSANSEEEDDRNLTTRKLNALFPTHQLNPLPQQRRMTDFYQAFRHIRSLRFFCHGMLKLIFLQGSDIRITTLSENKG